MSKEMKKLKEQEMQHLQDMLKCTQELSAKIKSAFDRTNETNIEIRRMLIKLAIRTALKEEEWKSKIALLTSLNLSKPKDRRIWMEANYTPEELFSAIRELLRQEGQKEEYAHEG